MSVDFKGTSRLVVLAVVVKKGAFFFRSMETWWAIQMERRSVVQKNRRIRKGLISMENLRGHGAVIFDIIPNTKGFHSSSSKTIQ